MQFRTRKTTVTLVRSVYDPAMKRCRAVTVGTLPIDVRQLPTDLRERLTPSERMQAERLCEANRLRHDREARVAMATHLPEMLRQAAAWYRAQPQSRGRQTALAQLAEASRAEWSEVLAAMCAAGVGRTRKRCKTSD